MRTHVTSQNGFTLIEVIVAIIILGIVAGGGTHVYANAQQATDAAEVRERATILADKAMARIKTDTGMQDFCVTLWRANPAETCRPKVRPGGGFENAPDSASINRDSSQALARDWDRNGNVYEIYVELRAIDEPFDGSGIRNDTDYRTFDLFEAKARVYTEEEVVRELELPTRFHDRATPIGIARGFVNSPGTEQRGMLRLRFCTSHEIQRVLDFDNDCWDGSRTPASYTLTPIDGGPSVGPVSGTADTNGFDEVLLPFGDYKLTATFEDWTLWRTQPERIRVTPAGATRVAAFFVRPRNSETRLCMKIRGTDVTTSQQNNTSTWFNGHSMGDYGNGFYQLRVPLSWRIYGATNYQTGAINMPEGGGDGCISLKDPLAATGEQLNDGWHEASIRQSSYVSVDSVNYGGCETDKPGGLGVGAPIVGGLGGSNSYNMRFKHRSGLSCTITVEMRSRPVEDWPPWTHYADYEWHQRTCSYTYGTPSRTYYYDCSYGHYHHIHSHPSPRPRGPYTSPSASGARTKTPLKT